MRCGRRRRRTCRSRVMQRRDGCRDGMQGVPAAADVHARCVFGEAFPGVCMWTTAAVMACGPLAHSVGRWCTAPGAAAWCRWLLAEQALRGAIVAAWLSGVQLAADCGGSGDMGVCTGQDCPAPGQHVRFPSVRQTECEGCGPEKTGGGDEDAPIRCPLLEQQAPPGLLPPCSAVSSQ